MYKCMHMHTQTHKLTNTHTYNTHNTYTHTKYNIHTHTHTHAKIHTQKCTHNIQIKQTHTRIIHKHTHVHAQTHKHTHIHTHIHTHTRHTHRHRHMHNHTQNTHLHLRTRGCYSTDDIRPNGLYHVVELLSLNVCHLLGLCDLKFILFPNIFSVIFFSSLVNLSNSDCYKVWVLIRITK